MKRILPFPLLLLLSVILVASPTKEEKAINIALSSEPVTLDVMVNTSITGRLVALGNVYEKLLVLDGNGTVSPELASAYTLSDNGRTLEFKLRKGVVFHDGTPLGAEDVVSSMNRWLSVYAQARNMVGDALFEKKDEETVVIRASESIAMLPYMIASAPQNAVIMPSRIADQGMDLVVEYIGTGPYMVSSWKSGESIELKAYEGYQAYGEGAVGIWGKKKAVVPVLRYYFVSDAVTRLLGLESGLYDAINDVMSDDRARIQSSSRMNLLEGGESGLIALVFNKKEGVFTSLDARIGASLALDAEELLRACYGEYGYSVHSDYMEVEQSLWSMEDRNPYGERDVVAASTHAIPGTIRILTSNLSNLDKIALAAKAELEEAGFKVEVNVCDWATMMEKRKDSSSWDIFISAFSQVPVPQLKSFLNPEFPGWVDPESRGMQLLEASSRAESEDEAAALWKEAQKVFWEEIPAYVPGHYSTSYAVSSSLDGVIIQNGFFFWNADVR